MPSHCSLCCKSCLTDNAVAQLGSENAPSQPLSDLGNFLPAGTLTLALGSRTIPCEHNHASDGWHTLPSYADLSQVAHPDCDSLLRMLDFLTEKLFVYATCKLADDAESLLLFVRVYMIPYDLPNVQGRLRTRDEADVVGPARRYLRTILPQIVQDHADWEGDNTLPSSSHKKSFFQPPKDDRTMAEIYSSLSSPSTEFDDEKIGPIASNVLEDNVLGLRTKLYPYQRRSIVAMLEKELNPSSVPDPLYIPIKGMDGKEFYLQPATLELLAERPRMQQVRGGILCEELGTGKTVMILGLILSTIDQLPEPEESFVEYRPVLTPLALRSFPFGEYSAARQRLSAAFGKKALWKAVEKKTVPSLQAMAIHSMRTHPECPGARYEQELLETLRALPAYEANVPFYLHYNEEPMETLRSRRRTVNPLPRVMYLTTASLVVVPVNLLNQWTGEILKHCEDDLRVLVVRDNKPLPVALILANKYDVVLLSHARYSAEATKNKLEQLHTWRTCHCPYTETIPVVACTCHNYPDVSPLFQIRWKRLVIDEGHVASSTTSNFVTLTGSLSIERCWIVTGTPTTNLMGLNFGEGSELQYPDEAELIGCTPVSSDDEDLETKRTRVWTPRDREDLNKLAHMITNFLKVPRFAADRSLFSSHVTAPLMSPTGPQFGSIEALVQVMEMVMIRHQIADVEQDILLPFLNYENVLLDLDPYAVLSYNVLQAGIVVNAVNSEREDQDYLFHASNATFLQHLIENMSQIMFWHADENLFNIKEMHRSRAGHFNRALKRGAAEEDLKLLENAFNQIDCALANSVWEHLMYQSSIFCRVFDIPPRAYHAWSILPRHIEQVSDANEPQPHFLLCPERLAKLASFIKRRPLSSMESIVEMGEMVGEEERLRLQFSLSRLHSSKSARRHKDSHEDKNLLLKTMDLKDPEKLKQIRQELLAAQAKVKAGFSQHEQGQPEQGQLPWELNPSSSSTSEMTRLLGRSRLAKTRLGNTTSSKLDFIISEVKLYSAREKFLIFSRSPLTLAYVNEQLELIGIKALHFTSKVELRVREQYVTTFETSDTYRVFLMELKHGARGLNLVSATRVIFCEPVWQADVETQAIKRVHRIGQTRPVTVKTLAIRATFEETMIARRDALKTRGESRGTKLPDFKDDRIMRDFLAHPTFLPFPPPPPQVRLNIPLLGDEVYQEAMHPTSPENEDEYRELVQQTNRMTSSTSTPKPTKRKGIKKPIELLISNEDDDDYFEGTPSKGGPPVPPRITRSSVHSNSKYQKTLERVVGFKRERELASRADEEKARSARPRKKARFSDAEDESDVYSTTVSPPPPKPKGIKKPFMFALPTSSSDEYEDEEARDSEADENDDSGVFMHEPAVHASSSRKRRESHDGDDDDFVPGSSKSRAHKQVHSDTISAPVPKRKKRKRNKNKKHIPPPEVSVQIPDRPILSASGAPYPTPSNVTGRVSIVSKMKRNPVSRPVVLLPLSSSTHSSAVASNMKKPVSATSMVSTNTSTTSAHISPLASSSTSVPRAIPTKSNSTTQPESSSVASTKPNRASAGQTKTKPIHRGDIGNNTRKRTILSVFEIPAPNGKSGNHITDKDGGDNARPRKRTIRFADESTPSTSPMLSASLGPSGASLSGASGSSTHLPGPTPPSRHSSDPNPSTNPSPVHGPKSSNDTPSPSSRKGEKPLLVTIGDFSRWSEERVRGDMDTENEGEERKGKGKASELEVEVD
ncbi:hypothetical protein K474DRAFT_1776489 [Panus rudis PR-1116 ss-1]|nr:hypothetical protein K474DRAFT_1776489 [Panus rudis PR-1116 ss-1]